jgi:lipopolysaccharide export system permease protein
MNRILDRYICCEFIPPFLGGLFLFSFILMMDKVLRLTDLVLVRGISLKIIVRLLTYLLPPLISFTIPMAILFASLMAFGRLASDNEVIAFRSCGLHPIRIIAPILVFGLLAFFVCFWLEVALIPLANRSFRDIVLSFEQQMAFLSLNEKGFQDLGDDLVAYIHKARKDSAKDDGYEGILITDYSLQGPSRVILAREGDISMDKSNGKMIISLINGSIHHLELEGENIYQMINFGRYETVLTLAGYSAISERKKKYKELSFNDIKTRLQSKSVSFQEETGLRLEWHRRFAFPFACVIFALIGSLIGMESKWSGKSSSFAVSVLVIVFYYFLLSVGSRLSMAGYLSPGISAWIPNIIFLGTGLCLFREVF